MKRMALVRAGVLATFAWFALALPAGATSYPVGFHYLTSSATITTPFEDGDTLLLDTVITTEVGALLQEITFTAGSSVQSAQGFAAWQVSEEDGQAPRLIDVDIDIFDESDNLVLSDTFSGVLSGFAHSTIDGALGPGTYRLVVTGNAIRDSVLDVSVTFSPEPGTAVLVSAGLGLLGFARRRTATA